MRRAALLPVLLLIAGCTFTAEVEITALADATRRPLPQLAVVRDAYQQTVTRKTIIYGFESEQLRLDDDLFGAPSAAADTGCVVAGLQTTLAPFEVFPTESFWREISPDRGRLDLAELLDGPIYGQLRALDVDILVIASHRRRPTEFAAAEGIVEGFVGYSELQTASAVAIDLQTPAVLAAVRAEAELLEFAGHTLFVVPMMAKISTTDAPCLQVGAELGNALLARRGDRPLLLVILAGASDPYAEAERPAPQPPAIDDSQRSADGVPN